MSIPNYGIPLTQEILHELDYFIGYDERISSVDFNLRGSVARIRQCFLDCMQGGDGEAMFKLQVEDYMLTKRPLPANATQRQIIIRNTHDSVLQTVANFLLESQVAK